MAEAAHKMDNSITNFFTSSKGSGPPRPDIPSTNSAGPKKPRKRGGKAKSSTARSAQASSAHPPSVMSPLTTTAGASDGHLESTESSAAQLPKPESVRTEQIKDGKLASGKARPKGKTEMAESVQKITAFFSVRRSERKGKTKKQIQKEREKDTIEKIKTGCEDGLKVVEIEGKGRGVIATKKFEKDDFVVEYAGELVNITTAKQREDLYARDQEVGCYMYYFNHKNKSYCIDATTETGKLGRLMNHSRKTNNCYTKVFNVGDTPHLVLLASQPINIGDECLYDYGDRSTNALESHPWLKE